MKGTIKTLVVILLVGILLAVTVPSEQSYKDHVTEKYGFDQNKALKENVRNTFNKLSGNLTSEYENHVIVAVASHQSSNEEVTSIGILGFWIDL